jgi:hypothetical protein
LSDKKVMTGKLVGFGRYVMTGKLVGFGRTA